jgi:hypothetical protein
MCENSFWVENLTAEKKLFALETLPPPFINVCREGILGQFGQIQKVAHAKITIYTNITEDYRVTRRS